MLLQAQETPQAQGSSERWEELHGSRREKWVQGNWGPLWFGSPAGSCVSPGAAVVTEFKRIFTESASFALTLSVLGGGAAIFFFFSYRPKIRF